VYVHIIVLQYYGTKACMLTSISHVNSSAALLF
jgi:hypothetical protein